MTTRTIPQPDPRREPLKVNIFRFVQNCPTALAPLFPYVDEGAIVPCAATFRGAPGRALGRFQHFNTVDEVSVVWGATGRPGRAVGMVNVGAKLHMVAPMNPAENPDDSLVLVITQRQKIGAPQREEVRFVCDKCERRLFLHELDATPPKRGTVSASGAAFITVEHSYEAARQFNEDSEARICKHCGHHNPPFPLDEWGWGVHVHQSEIARRGVTSLNAMPAAPAAHTAPKPGGA